MVSLLNYSLTEYTEYLVIMTDKDVELFLELMQTRNITAAARNLYTSQSALTKRIQNLERYLGCSLFIRSHKGLMPTPEAEAILPYMKELADSLRKIRSKTAGALNSVAGSLRVGVSVNYAHYHFPNVLKRYMDSYPKVDISVTTGLSKDIYRQFVAKDFSVAIVRGDYPWGEGDLTLFDEPVYLVKSTSAKDIPLDTLPYIGRNTDPHFQDDVNQWLEEKGIHKQKNARLTINDIATCVAMVERGIGWSILPAICLDGFTGIREPILFKDKTPFTRKTRLLYHNDYYSFQQVRLFTEMVMSEEYHHHF